LGERDIVEKNEKKERWGAATSFKRKKRLEKLKDSTRRAGGLKRILRFSLLQEKTKNVRMGKREKELSL